MPAQTWRFRLTVAGAAFSLAIPIVATMIDKYFPLFLLYIPLLPLLIVTYPLHIIGFFQGAPSSYRSLLDQGAIIGASLGFLAALAAGPALGWWAGGRLDSKRSAS